MKDSQEGQLTSLCYFPKMPQLRTLHGEMPIQHWVGHFVLSSQTGVENTLSFSRGTILGNVGSFWSRWTFSDRTALAVECSLISGCGHGHELARTSEGSCGSSLRG